MGEPTWEYMIERQPLLLSLYRDAKKIKDEGGLSFCANKVWYDDFKPRLVKLVGFECKTKELKTQEAYDRAYKKVYSVLPNCRNCICY